VLVAATRRGAWDLRLPNDARNKSFLRYNYRDDHEPPHFHARYGSQKARFAIDDLRILDGHLGPRARGLVVEWATLHLEELRREWDLAKAHEPLFAIEPLD
jgi:hypothetical protein